MTDTNKQSNNRLRALTLSSIDRPRSYVYYDGWLEYFEGAHCNKSLTDIGSYKICGLNSFVDRTGLSRQAILT